MRDIRIDLRERLDDLDSQRKVLIAELKGLDAKRETVGALLQAEDERFGNPANRGTTVIVSEIKPVHNLGDLMRLFLADGSQLSTQRLAELAVSNGHPFGDKKPRRSVHFALLGMEKGGHVKRGEDGSWCLANGEARAP